jgi:formate/nitrite transporter FocA (FNT family)
MRRLRASIAIAVSFWTPIFLVGLYTHAVFGLFTLIAVVCGVTTLSDVVPWLLWLALGPFVVSTGILLLAGPLFWIFAEQEARD